VAQGSKIHLIAIGGSVMHNLAIDLHLKGYQVSGSDDEIYEPTLGRLAQYGLLPQEMGWHAEKITEDMQAVILGMHAREDNPEIAKAKELNIPIYSYPEFIYRQSVDKHRVVVAGSHGKTTITAMIIHALKFNNRKFDYLIGALVDGFDQMLRLSEDAPLIVIEGDEYLSSTLDKTPKFLHYKHHIGIMSGVSWDHINVYPTIEAYVGAFEDFADETPKGGFLVYSQDDAMATVIGGKDRPDVHRIDYEAHPHKIKDGKTFLITDQNQEVPLLIFGEHNMKNINAAKLACQQIGLEADQFYNAIQSFKGASKRLEKIAEDAETIIFRDFAHAPSKLLATTEAVKEQYPNRELVACLELHSYSSLNKTFLKQYKNCFNAADTAIVYYNPENIEQKQMEMIDKEQIQNAFKHKNLFVFDHSEALFQFLSAQKWNNKNLLLMSSGNFGNLNFKLLTETLIKIS